VLKGVCGYRLDLVFAGIFLVCTAVRSGKQSSCWFAVGSVCAFANECASTSGIFCFCVCRASSNKKPYPQTYTCLLANTETSSWFVFIRCLTFCGNSVCTGFLLLPTEAMSKNNFITITSIPSSLAIKIISLYQYLSAGRPVSCRFLPSCSSYAKEAFQIHGFFMGFSLTARRLLRCRPLGGSGFDPVPLPTSHS
jgi:uncharacterized protein